MKKEFKFLILGSAAASAILLAFVLMSSSAEGTTWEIPDFVPNAVSGVKHPGIKCSAQQVLNVVDSQGRLIVAKPSPTYSDNPYLTWTATTSGNPIAGSVSNINFGCISSSGDLVVEPSTLTMRVIGQKAEGGSKGVLAIKSITTKEMTIPKNTKTLKELTYIGILGKELEQQVQSTKKFKNNLEYQISGNIKIYWKGYPNTKYTFPISVSNIPVQYSANYEPAFDPKTSPVKTIDTDGDRIIDIYDTCPTSAENYNGFNDNDGCPDNKPNDNTPKPGTEEKPVDKNTCPADQVWVVNHCEPKPKANDDVLYLDDSDVILNIMLEYQDGKQQAFLIPENGVKVFKADFKKLDLGDASLPTDPSSGDNFAIEDSRAGVDGKYIKRTVVEAYLRVPQDTPNKYEIVKSNIKFRTTLEFNEEIIQLQDKIDPSFRSQPIKDFFGGYESKTGNGFKGAFMGRASFTSLELIQAISKSDKYTSIGSGERIKFSYKTELDGDIVMSDKSSQFTNVVTGAYVKWSQYYSKTSPLEQPGAPTCPTGQRNMALEGDINCVPIACYGIQNEAELQACLNNVPVDECLDGVDNTDDNIHIDCAPPKIGQPGVLVCVDSAKPGGFPCTEEYRNVYCDGTTNCSVPPSQDKKVPKQDDNVPDGTSDKNISDSGDNPKGSKGFICTTIEECRTKANQIDWNDPTVMIVVVLVAVVLIAVAFSKRKR